MTYTYSETYTWGLVYESVHNDEPIKDGCYLARIKSLKFDMVLRNENDKEELLIAKVVFETLRNGIDANTGKEIPNSANKFKYAQFTFKTLLSQFMCLNTYERVFDVEKMNNAKHIVNTACKLDDSDVRFYIEITTCDGHQLAKIIQKDKAEMMLPMNEMIYVNHRKEI